MKKLPKKGYLSHFVGCVPLQNEIRPLIVSILVIYPGDELSYMVCIH